MLEHGTRCKVFDLGLFVLPYFLQEKVILLKPVFPLSPFAFAIADRTFSSHANLCKVMTRLHLCSIALKYYNKSVKYLSIRVLAKMYRIN